MASFLRRRREIVERVWLSDRYTAQERGSALTALAGCVIVVRHPYQRHPKSGAGNCWCGSDSRSSIHDIVAEPKQESVSNPVLE